MEIYDELISTLASATTGVDNNDTNDHSVHIAIYGGHHRDKEGRPQNETRNFYDELIYTLASATTDVNNNDTNDSNNVHTMKQ